MFSTLEFTQIPLDPNSVAGMTSTAFATNAALPNSRTDGIESPTTVRAVAFVYIPPEQFRKPR
jgi:hypothetical protein